MKTTTIEEKIKELLDRYKDDETKLKDSIHFLHKDFSLLADEIRKEEREIVLEIVNNIAHEEAKKWEDELTWKQPYAGNRLKGIAWSVRDYLNHNEK